MRSGTCEYVARKADPEGWHGTDPHEFSLDSARENGGLGITEWHCPHPALGGTDTAEGASETQLCVFHTDPDALPAEIDEGVALRTALEDAGSRPDADRPEHRGQFVGARFGAVDLAGETIAATDGHDIRFDHARFQADGSNLNFEGTRFVTKGQHPVSFAGTEFIATDTGDLEFSRTTFQTEGEGTVRFPRATFRADGAGYVRFNDSQFRVEGAGDVLFRMATFRTSTTGKGAVRFEDAVFVTEGGSDISGPGDVRFGGATFCADGEGNVDFPDATFHSNGAGEVSFVGATFHADGEHRGAVWFERATFRTTGDGDGDVNFYGATFRAEDEGPGEGVVVFNDANFLATGRGTVKFGSADFRVAGVGQGGVWFEDATFRPEGQGDVGFRSATFRAVDEGNLTFEGAQFDNADFRRVDFADAIVGGAEFTGTDLREADLTDVSINGATTTERLNEGYGDDPSIGRISVVARLRRLLEGSEFDAAAWDATARAYHQFKSVFSDHGLVGNARRMHVRERRARSLEAKAANGWLDRRYLRSLPSRVFTGYGVQVQNLAVWMIALFSFSTSVYVTAGVEDTLVNNIAYSVLAFTVAPPRIPSEVGVQFVMMVETFFGTLSIVLLGYILGNRERF